MTSGPDEREAQAGAVMLTVALLVMASIGSLYAWSVLIGPLERELGASRGAVSAVFSVAIASFTLAMLWGASLQERMTPARLVLLTGVIAAAGLVLPLAAYSLPGLLVGVGIGFGLANGLGYGLAIALAQAAVPARRGLATGLAVAAYTLGAALFAPLLAWSGARLGVPATLMGWAGAMLALGAVASSALARAGATLPRRDAPRRDEESSTSEPKLISRAFAALWLGFLFASLAGVTVIGHAAAIVGRLGDDQRSAALAAGLVAVANGVGRLGGGWLTDRLAPRLFLTAGMLATAFCLLLLSSFPSRGLALAALGVTGIGYGAVAGAYPAAVAQIYGPALASRVYSRVFTSWGVAGLAGPFLAGALFDRTGSYGAALLASAAAALLAAACCAAIPGPPPTTRR